MTLCRIPQGTSAMHSPVNSGRGCAECDAMHARAMEKYVGTGPYVDPFERGAAVAFGLMGMAMAIREGHWGCIHERFGPTGLRCRHCNVYMGIVQETPDRSADR